MGSADALRWCGECRAEQVFEVPPCEDGHGVDCPDLACTGCGAAVVVGLAAVDLPPAAHAAAA